MPKEVRDMTAYNGSVFEKQLKNLKRRVVDHIFKIQPDDREAIQDLRRCAEIWGIPIPHLLKFRRIDR